MKPKLKNKGKNIAEETKKKCANEFWYDFHPDRWSPVGASNKQQLVFSQGFFFFHSYICWVPCLLFSLLYANILE